MLPAFLALTLILSPLGTQPLKALPVIPPAEYYKDQYGVEYPPLKYAYTPKRPILRIEVPLAEVNQNCFYAPLAHVMLACTKPSEPWILALLTNPNVSDANRDRIVSAMITNSNVCVIIMAKVDKQMSVKWQQSILHHEYAHCNGLIHDGNGYGWYLPDGTQIK